MKRSKKVNNRKALSNLIKNNKIKIYKTAKSILLDEKDICFAIQETILYGYKELQEDGFENQETFFLWILRILINKCYEINESRANEECNIIKNEINFKETYLDKVLKNFDDEQKVIAILYYYDDLDINKISKVLDIPEKIIKSSLTRIRINLYKMLNKGGELHAK